MLYAMLAACATLMSLCPGRSSRDQGPSHACGPLRAQEEWAETMDRHDSPLEK